ncbi:hypothetical protein ABFS82_05G061000 [Erythranthe guttata]
MNPPTQNDDGQSSYAIHLVNASVLPMALKACIELDVLEIIHRAGPHGPLSSFQIASQIPNCHNPHAASNLLDRMLALLASYSILTCSVSNGPQKLYSLGPVSKYFVANANGVSLAPLFLLNQDKVMMDTWHHMKDAVIEGGLAPFNRAYGMDASEYVVKKNPSYFQLFKNSMSNYNSMFMEKLVDTYRGFEGLESIVDVGGGDGSVLNTIVGKYPNIKGINFDLASVIDNNKSVYPGIEYISGDMFTSIPKGDAMFLKWMLHSWDDDNCVRILKNCYNALPENGKVIIIELVVPEIPETRAEVQSKLQFDLIMMNMNPNGKERTITEFDVLAQASGFSTTKLQQPSIFDFSLLEFQK